METGTEKGTGIETGKGEKIGLDEMIKGTEERRRRKLKGEICLKVKFTGFISS